jgi:hypothetical protein
VLIPDAFVYHKRRVTLRDFFKQVSGFGKGRIQVGRAHAGEVKFVHALPAFFTLGLLALPFLLVLDPVLFFTGVTAYLVYSLLLLFDCYRTSRNLLVSLLCVPAAFVQLTGYGTGFLKEWSRI